MNEVFKIKVFPRFVSKFLMFQVFPHFFQIDKFQAYPVKTGFMYGNHVCIVYKIFKDQYFKFRNTIYCTMKVCENSIQLNLF